jgi:hypothetical protein
MWGLIILDYNKKIGQMVPYVHTIAEKIGKARKENVKNQILNLSKIKIDTATPIAITT